MPRLSTGTAEGGYLADRYRFGVGAASSAAFSPTDIAGIQAWFDASDASSFTFSSGSVVSQWNDKSGNARHVTQGTVANQPGRTGSQNSLSTVVFDGTDYLDRSSVTISQPFTVLIVGKRTSGVSGAWFSGTGTAIYTNSAGNYAYFAGTERAAVAVNTSYHQITAVFNGASSTLRVDASAVTSLNPGAGGVSALGIGANPGGTALLTGEIGEVIVYSSLGTTDQATLEAYLKAKWATP